MLEQVIRPFQTPQVLATRRIVKSVRAVATEQKAILTWGAAGTIPAGARQTPPKTASLIGNAGFTLQNSQENWKQTGTPETETVQVGGVTIKRVRVIGFSTIANSLDAQPFSLAASAVSDVMAGLVREMPGSKTKHSTYNTQWD